MRRWCCFTCRAYYRFEAKRKWKRQGTESVPLLGMRKRYSMEANGTESWGNSSDRTARFQKWTWNECGPVGTLITQYDNSLIWTLFCCFQTFPFQVLKNFASGHVFLLAALVERENLRTYDDTDACDVTSVWINCCSHYLSLSGDNHWGEILPRRSRRNVILDCWL